MNIAGAVVLNLMRAVYEPEIIFFLFAGSININKLVEARRMSCSIHRNVAPTVSKHQFRLQVDQRAAA